MKKEKIVDNPECEEQEAPETELEQELAAEEAAEIETENEAEDLEFLKAENQRLKEDFLRAYADAETSKNAAPKKLKKTTNMPFPLLPKVC